MDSKRISETNDRKQWAIANITAWPQTIVCTSVWYSVKECSDDVDRTGVGSFHHYRPSYAVQCKIQESRKLWIHKHEDLWWSFILWGFPFSFPQSAGGQTSTVMSTCGKTLKNGCTTPQFKNFLSGLNIICCCPKIYRSKQNKTTSRSLISGSIDKLLI